MRYLNFKSRLVRANLSPLSPKKTTYLFFSKKDMKIFGNELQQKYFKVMAF